MTAAMTSTKRFSLSPRDERGESVPLGGSSAARARQDKKALAPEGPSTDQFTPWAGRGAARQIAGYPASPWKM